MHINHFRGETRTFALRREHKGTTHHTYHKGKRQSARLYKQKLNRSERRKAAHLLLIGEEPMGRMEQRSVLWLMA